MPKLTLEQISPGDAKRLGTIYRNLIHYGFKKAMLSFSDVDIIYRCFGIKISVGDNMYLYVSEYVTLMNKFYELYRWGTYDDEDECVWLLNKIKSEAWHKIRNQCYGRLNYHMLVALVHCHGKACKLKLNPHRL